MTLAGAGWGRAAPLEKAPGSCRLLGSSTGKSFPGGAAQGLGPRSTQQPFQHRVPHPAAPVPVVGEDAGGTAVDHPFDKLQRLPQLGGGPLVIAPLGLVLLHILLQGRDVRVSLRDHTLKPFLGRPCFGQIAFALLEFLPAGLVVFVLLGEETKQSFVGLAGRLEGGPVLGQLVHQPGPRIEVHGVLGFDLLAPGIAERLGGRLDLRGVRATCGGQALHLLVQSAQLGLGVVLTGQRLGGLGLELGPRLGQGLGGFLMSRRVLFRFLPGPCQRRFELLSPAVFVAELFLGLGAGGGERLLGAAQRGAAFVELPLESAGRLLGRGPGRQLFLKPALGLSPNIPYRLFALGLGRGPLVEMLLHFPPGLHQGIDRFPVIGHFVQGRHVAQHRAVVGEHRRRPHSQPAHPSLLPYHAEFLGKGSLADDGLEPVADEAVAVLGLHVARPAFAEALVGGASAGRLGSRVAGEAASFGIEHQEGCRR